jgi:hypothetical protein
MRAYWSATCAAILVGALACAGNTAKVEDETGAVAADTTRDTTGQNPSGYRGMERDTSMVPPSQPSPSDTFLQEQGTGQPQDTSGYSGMERVDTTRMQHDTTGMQADTSGMQADTTGMQPGMQMDTTSGMGGQDTSGYQRSQQQDSSSN